jgi:predicted Zn finger-like uncharacterized protein
LFRARLYNFQPMSLITRCPSCQTLFKVVPDQLRISEGWVRCGQCDEIFDAALHLLQAPPAPELPSTQRPELPEALTAVDASGLPAAEVSPVDEGSSVPMPLVEELDGLDESAHPIGTSDLALSAVSTVMAPGYAADAGRDAAETDFRAELDEVSFLQDSKSGVFWHRPIMRATLVLLSLVLLLGLLGQIVLHERDRIVALEPGLRPLLLAICAPLNCVVSPLRRIESIVIDSSSFNRLQGDSYRLNFTIKNTADISLAVSAIELTLTDSLDQPVVRRVLLPSELGFKSDAMTAGAEWPISLALEIKVMGTSDRIAGYRLLTFYP